MLRNLPPLIGGFFAEIIWVTHKTVVLTIWRSISVLIFVLKVEFAERLEKLL